jgi:hypothetical protein
MKSRRIVWLGYVARMAEINAHKILVGKPDGKKPLGRPRRRWENDIRMDLWETGWEGADWTHLAEDRDQWRAVVNSVLNLWVP